MRTSRVIIFSLVSILILAQLSLGIKSFPHSEFNITPDILSLNWTNSYQQLINITNNRTTANISILFLNSTTLITPNYSQQTLFSDSRYLLPTGCFNLTNSTQNNPLTIVNGTGSAAASYTLNATLKANYTIVHSAVCPPGRYFGYLTVQNFSNSSEAANITITINVPVSASNELSTTLLTGGFKGLFTAGDQYHSYYFNTSEVSGSTQLTANISFSSGDLELFLFDASGSLRSKSITSSLTETLNTPGFASNQMWELRLYSNATSNYTASLLYTTLNLSNSSSNLPLTQLGFQNRNIASSAAEALTLQNIGTQNMTSVSQQVELYHLDLFSSSASRNFTFIVPQFATSVKAIVNWTGSANYSVTLYNPAGSVAAVSTQKRIFANATGAMQEHYAQTAAVQEGVWILAVTNTSVSTDLYTAQAIYYIPSSQWFTSNYSAQTFQSTNSTTLSFTFTPPINTTGGIIRGHVNYTDSKGAALQIPISANITASTLLANATLRSLTINLSAQAGFNYSGSTISFSVSINNTGVSPTGSFTAVTSASSLRNGSSFVNTSVQLPATIEPGSAGSMLVNITIGTTETQNSAGIYTGFVYVNSSNSYPYGLNISINLNLTKDLTVLLSSLTSAGADDYLQNATRGENFTIAVQVLGINSSGISNLTPTNFSVWLVEQNTSTRMPESGSFTTAAGLTPFHNGTHYLLNFTVPGATKGGVYNVTVSAGQDTGGAILSGGSAFSQLRINNTGFNLTPISSTSLSINEGESAFFNLTARNLGLLAATAEQLTLDASGCSVTVSAYSSTCPVQSSSSAFTFNMTPSNLTGCQFIWNITANNISADQTCSNVTIKTPNAYSNLTFTINLDNQASSSSSSSSSSSGGGGAGSDAVSCTSDTQCTASQACTNSKCAALSCTQDQYIKDHKCLDYTFSLDVQSSPQQVQLTTGEQAEAKVTVKNTGERDTAVKLRVQTIDGITQVVSPEKYDLKPAGTGIFSVTFTESGASLGSHASKFIAYREGHESTSDSADFTLVVAAGQQRQEKLKQDAADAQNWFTKLSAQYQSMQSALGASTEQAAALFESSKKSLADLNSAIEAGDYTSAEAAISSFNTSMNELQKLLEESKPQAGGVSSIIFWGIVAVIAAAIIIVVVKFVLVPKGYDPERGYTPPQQPRPAQPPQGYPDRFRQVYRFRKN